jgi:hypothetical protein
LNENSGAGARQFLFINVPPIDRSPLVRISPSLPSHIRSFDIYLCIYNGDTAQMLAQSTSAQALEKTVIAGFNTKLAAKIAAFKAANSGVRSSLPLFPIPSSFLPPSLSPWFIFHNLIHNIPNHGCN